MNCAPITATGGSSTSRRIVKDRRGPYDRNRRQSSSYPDLFLANIGEASGGCDTAEALSQQVAIEYPNPGSNVLTPEGAEGLFKQACDGNPRNGGGSGSGSGGSATGAAGAAPSATGAAASGQAGSVEASGIKP